jgi:hypothetical protein
MLSDVVNASMSRARSGAVSGRATVATSRIAITVVNATPPTTPVRQLRQEARALDTLGLI